VNILTVRNDGLGDLLLTLPTLASLRRLYPASRLGVLVRPDCALLFELYSDPVEVWCDDASAKTRVRRDRPDVMLFLKPDPGWAKRAFLSRVPRRIGTRHRWQSLLFNERVPVHRRSSGRHEAECNALVAAPLGVTLPLPPVRLRVPPHGEERALQALTRAGQRQGESFVVIHPGSHSSAPNWPREYYSGLVERLAASGHPVIVTCGPREVELARSVAGSSGRALEPVDLVALAGVLAGALVVVSGSTGPMHLACALGVPVVALFSSRPPHTPDRWGPWGETSGSSVVLQSPPVAHASGEDLSGLAPEDVFQAVIKRAGVGRAVR